MSVTTKQNCDMDQYDEANKIWNATSLTLNRRLDHNFDSDVVSHKGWIVPRSLRRCLHPHPWASGQPQLALAGQIHSRKTHVLVCLQHIQCDGLYKMNHIVSQISYKIRTHLSDWLYGLAENFNNNRNEKIYFYNVL